MQNEEKYAEIKEEILGGDSDEESGSEEGSDEEDDEDGQYPFFHVTDYNILISIAASSCA